MRRLLTALAMLCLPTVTAAQETPEDRPAVLVADRVFVTSDEKLVAEGNVAAYHATQTIKAARITYDRRTGSLTIEGPIRLTEGDRVTILADAAELDEDLQNGLLTGARMVLDDQLQLAAVQIGRTNGRYSQLYKTAVTSCRVCEEGEAPLWQIRARRVIHDQQERQLYFDDAQFRVLDVPVFYLPRLRLPDPTLERASGFLYPSTRTTSQLGTGIRIPYFFRLGDHADLTLAPYLSSGTTTLDFRYRQAFRSGRISFEGAYTEDDLLPDNTRGYLFGQGIFQLSRDYELSFDIEWVSDDAYLLDYGVSDKDRLDSEIALTRTYRDQFTRAALIHYDSLRDGEDESLIPTIVADFQHERRYFPDRLGGEVRLGFFGHTHHRTSNLDMLGRDVSRLTAEIDWLRNWVLPIGLRADWQMGLAVDVFDIQQDSAFQSDITRTTPHASLSLRYPMTRSTASGATHFLEPVVQIGWSDSGGGDVPIDESGRVEFDQGNLLSLSRFPAKDAREEGFAFAYGLNWSRFGTSGWQTNFTIGQIIRDDAIGAFSETSGLVGTSSDFLFAGQIQTDFGFDLTARTLFNENLDVAKAELRGDWRGTRTEISGSYIWLDEDPDEDRTQSVSEIYLDGSYNINRFWTASANWRYDLADTRAATAGIGLAYRNECVEVDLSLNRRYTSSTSVEPSTDFGFNIAFRGFGVSSGTERYVRSCNNT
ncbi:organic solvent tolerance protein [Thalassococcus sp. S3]|nr:organic solvent tolerance protein [Thalassococcus sp. S3]